MKITRGNPGVFTEELPGHYLDFNHNDITDKIQKEEIVKEGEKAPLKKTSKLNEAPQYQKALDNAKDLIDKV